MRLASMLLASLLAGCATQAAPPTAAPAPLQRGVHSGEKDKIAFYEALTPACENQGYPEVTIVKPPSHGTVSSAPGEDYPNFARDNVRYECNRRLVKSTQVFYQSNPDFHGNDSVSIEVRFPSSHLDSQTYAIEVR